MPCVCAVLQVGAGVLGLTVLQRRGQRGYQEQEVVGTEPAAICSFPLVGLWGLK